MTFRLIVLHKVVITNYRNTFEILNAILTLDITTLLKYNTFIYLEVNDSESNKF